MVSADLGDELGSVQPAARYIRDAALDRDASRQCWGGMRPLDRDGVSGQDYVRAEWRLRPDAVLMGGELDEVLDAIANVLFGSAFGDIEGSNRMCDVVVAWSVWFAGGAVLVTSDQNFLRKRAQLARWGIQCRSGSSGECRYTYGGRGLARGLGVGEVRVPGRPAYEGMERTGTSIRP